jgi:hypothetical protein
MGLGVAQFDLDAGLGHRAQGNADIRFAVADSPGDFARRADLQMKADALVLVAKARDQRRQEVEGKALGAGHAHMPAAQAAQARDVAGDPLDVLLRSPRMRRQHFAGRVGHHAARMTLEQQRVEFALQARHLPAHGRGRDVELERRIFHRAGFHDLEKVADRGLLQRMKAHQFLPATGRTTRLVDCRFGNPQF